MARTSPCTKGSAARGAQKGKADKGAQKGKGAVDAVRAGNGTGVPAPPATPHPDAHAKGAGVPAATTSAGAAHGSSSDDTSSGTSVGGTAAVGKSTETDGQAKHSDGTVGDTTTRTAASAPPLPISKSGVKATDNAKGSGTLAASTAAKVIRKRKFLTFGDALKFVRTLGLASELDWPVNHILN